MASDRARKHRAAYQSAANPDQALFVTMNDGTVHATILPVGYPTGADEAIDRATTIAHADGVARAIVTRNDTGATVFTTPGITVDPEDASVDLRHVAHADRTLAEHIFDAAVQAADYAAAAAALEGCTSVANADPAAIAEMRHTLAVLPARAT